MADASSATEVFFGANLAALLINLLANRLPDLQRKAAENRALRELPSGAAGELEFVQVGPANIHSSVYGGIWSRLDLAGDEVFIVERIRWNHYSANGFIMGIKWGRWTGPGLQGSSTGWVGENQSFESGFLGTADLTRNVDVIITSALIENGQVDLSPNVAVIRSLTTFTNVSGNVMGLTLQGRRVRVNWQALLLAT